MPRPGLVRSATATALALLAWASAGGSSPQDGPRTPPIGAGRVDFDSQVRPIFEARCLNCHARGKYKGGLSLETREAALKGGEGGPAIVPGKSAESLLVGLISGDEPDRRMPGTGDPLSGREVELIRDWVDQGASWPEGSGLGFRKAPIGPRTPEVPLSAGGLDHPVDRFVARHREARGVATGWPEVPDRVFARRASLDLVGLLPSADRLAAFEQDTRVDRHLRFAEALLDDRDAYAAHWLTFWNDALRNAYRGTGFIDGGRKTITRWLYRSLRENVPYDRFVRELVSPEPGSGAEGFIKGIVWRGVVNASQLPPVQAAQNVTQVFLGTNLKCASCHDSFVNRWKLADAYALAAVFAEKPLEISRCDQSTGRMAAVGFLYPELGSIDPAAPRADRLKQLAGLLVGPEDGRFARTIVNRLWAQLMGRGIVEPLDDMDQPAWDQDLLDWLASDFVGHGHDLKRTLALIASSRSYRLPSRGVAAPGDRSAFAFRGPSTRRMTAEQFADAVASVTGAWPEVDPAMLKVDGRGQGGQLLAARAAVGDSGPFGPIRASLAFDDPLMTALGRTGREQVVTRRDPIATTLQALELTNGATLDARLDRGARLLLDRRGRDPESLARGIFLGALGRPPSPAELAASAELIGEPATAEGLRDFLWAVAMLPEFQLID